MSQFAQRIERLRPSPVREILKIISQPVMISFAGGLPAAESFPKLDTPIPSDYLQYGPSEGEPALRDTVSLMLGERGLKCDPSQVLILSGSQQGIDLVAKLLVEQGSEVAVEFPTYLAALQVFEIFGAQFVDSGAISSRTRLSYINPTFQNPTGHCYSNSERAAMARRCDEANVILFEDDPYHDLAYEACCRKPVSSYLKTSSWIYQGSFSKSMAPGLRLGYLACSEDLVGHITMLKQAADLHSNRISQFLVLDQLQKESQPERLHRLQAAYRNKRDNFEELLQRYLGEVASWQTPPGGLFFWLNLDPATSCDTRALLQRSLKRNVAFLPGEHFYPQASSGRQQLRLNFSHATMEQAEKGIKTLAELVHESADVVVAA